MKKFLKLTTVVVSMVMALTFVSCANENTSNNGNENSNEEQLNLVGTYGFSKVEYIFIHSTNEESIIRTMPTSTALHVYCKYKHNEGDTIVQEMDYTVNKIAGGYSFDWRKYEKYGVAQDDEAKTAIEKAFTDDEWDDYTSLFAWTITITEDGTWSDNHETAASSGTYTVDKANSKVTMTTLTAGGNPLDAPEIMEATYSNNGETLVVVDGESYDGGTSKTTMTFTRK